MIKLLKSLTAVLIVGWSATSALAANAFDASSDHIANSKPAINNSGIDELAGMVAELERLNRADLEKRH